MEDCGVLTGSTWPALESRFCEKPLRKVPGFTLLELLVVIAVIGLLVAMLAPAVQQAREAARRLQCGNRERQLGLALHLFHDAHRAFPPSGWTRAADSNPGGRFVGWRPLILPYLEQRALRDLYDVNADWWAPANRAAATTPIAVFRCPSTPARALALSAPAKAPRPPLMLESPLAPTDFEAIMGVQPASVNVHLPTPIYNSSNRFGVLHRNSETRFADIRDGASNTAMVVECAARPDVYRGRVRTTGVANDQGIGWADSEGPFSLDGANDAGDLEGCAACRHAMNRKNDNEPFGFHPGGCQFLFADGHVRFVGEETDLAAAAALFTAAGGEAIAAP